MSSFGKLMRGRMNDRLLRVLNKALIALQRRNTHDTNKKNPTSLNQVGKEDDVLKKHDLMFCMSSRNQVEKMHNFTCFA